MGVVVWVPEDHWQTSREGRGTPSGHSLPDGQFSENQIIVFSSRRTCMSAPRSSAPNFLVSPNARQLTVDSSMPSMSAYACATERSWSIPVMTEISVNLPHQSRVMLPHASFLTSGYSTAMKTKENIRAELLKWVAAGLTSKKLKPAAAEKKAGHPSAIRNLRSGKSDIWRPDIIHDFAMVFGPPPSSVFDSTSTQSPPAEPDANLPPSIESMITKMEAEAAASERQAEESRARAEELRAAIRVWKQVLEKTG